MVWKDRHEKFEKADKPDYKWLWVFTSYYKWLRVTKIDYESDYEWLKMNTSDYEPYYEWLQVTTSNYKGVRVTTNNYGWLHVTLWLKYRNYDWKEYLLQRK